MMKTHEPDHPHANPPDPVSVTLCCDDPTPAFEQGRLYCQCCDTDLIPATLLTRARQLYVGMSEPVSGLELAESTFDQAMVDHAKQSFQATAENPEGTGYVDQDEQLDEEMDFDDPDHYDPPSSEPLVESDPNYLVTGMAEYYTYVRADSEEQALELARTHRWLRTMNVEITDFKAIKHP